MPQIQINTNASKSKFDEAFVQGFLAAVAQTIGAPKEAILLQIVPDQLMYLRATSETCAFVKFGAGAAKLTTDLNKALSATVCTELEKIGIPSNRAYIQFIPLEKENIGYDKRTYHDKFGY